MSDPFNFPKRAAAQSKPTAAPTSSEASSPAGKTFQSFDAQAELSAEDQALQAMAAQETITMTEFATGYFSHFFKKCADRPYIPIGFLLTCAALHRMVKYRHQPLLMNKYARWRIGLQGVTFGGIMWAMFQDGREKHGGGMPWDWYRGRTAVSPRSPE